LFAEEGPDFVTEGSVFANPSPVGKTKTWKKGFRFFLFLFFALLIYFGFVWFQANRLLRSEKNQKHFIEKIQLVSGGGFTHEGLKVGFSPNPTLTFLNPKLTFADHPTVIESEKLCLDFNIISIAWGRTEPSEVYAFGVKLHTSIPAFPGLEEFQLQNAVLKTGAIRSGLAIPVQMSGDVGGQPQAFDMKGHFFIPSLERLEWEQVSMRLLFNFKDLPIASAATHAPDRPPFFIFKGGFLNGSFETKKQQGSGELDFTGTGKVRKVSYEIHNEKDMAVPLAFDVEMDLSGVWNAAAEELKINKSQFQLPFGSLETNGSLKLGTGEIPSFYFSAKDLVLEKMVAYWPGIENVLPFKIGFSGASQWILNLEGTLDHLRIHLNVDFKQALFTYGQYFTKPKDIPLTATFDYLIRKGSTLSGDFSVRFQEMSLKGNLTDLDMGTGTGQLNLLTNKFSVSGWESYIPMLQDFKIDGDAKILANWKGDLRALEKTDKIFHITIEKGSWTDADGKGIRNADLSLDYSPLMLEGRQMKFDLGKSPVVADLKIAGTGEQKESFFHLSAGELNLNDAWDSVRALFQSKAGTFPEGFWDDIKTAIHGLFPSGQTVQNFSVDISNTDRIWNISKLHAQVYGGVLDLSGWVDPTTQPVQYQSEGEIKGLNLDLFLNRAGLEKQWFGGSTILKFSVDGSGWGRDAWTSSLKGRGQLNLTEGRFGFMDPVGALSSIEPLSSLASRMKSPNSFNELDFNWVLSGGKVETEDFLVKSSDYVVDGEGTLGFDGLLNLRWDMYLPTSLAAEIFPGMAETFHRETRAHLGPITLLISGLADSPHIKPDPARAEELMQMIREEKARSLLRELVLD